MLTADLAPGVLHQTVDAGAPPVTPLRGDVAGFVGIAERGPVDVPVPVETWAQFTSWFGGCTGYAFLAHAVRGFLENGGRRCWVVRVASDDPVVGAAAASTLLQDAAGPAWAVRASSPGTWGDRLVVDVREAVPAQVRSVGHDPEGRWSDVPSVAGFTRAALVRASQDGATVAVRVLAALDPARSRLHWVHPDPGAGLPGDGRLIAPDPARPLLLEVLEYRVLVSEAGRLVRVVDGLSLVPQHPRYGPVVLAPVRPGDPDGAAAPEPVVIEELRPATDRPSALVLEAMPRALAGGRAGLAALTPHDLVGHEVAPEDSDLARARGTRGLRTLEAVAEVAMLVVPDVHVHPDLPNPVVPAPACVPDPCLDPPVPGPGPTLVAEVEVPPVLTMVDVHAVQAEMVGQCERRRDRVALLDPPRGVALDVGAGLRGVLDWRARFDTSYAALVHPWLAVSDPVRPVGTLRLVPPAGHVAGLVAASEREQGIHRAPANRRVGWAVAPSVEVDEQHHAILNTAGVDVVRTVAGRGLRLMGARTMSSDPDWRFLNVRRLMILIEQALVTGLQWAVFEPNGLLTRARATMTATFLLDALHQAGMLAGATAEESFYVRCDLDNNPPELRDLGQLVVEVGVAPSQPFEFVVVRVGRVRDALTVLPGAPPLGATGTGV